MPRRLAAFVSLLAAACSFQGTGGSGGAAQLGSTDTGNDTAGATASAGSSTATSETTTGAGGPTSGSTPLDTGMPGTSTAAEDGPSTTTGAATDEAGTTAAPDPCASPPTVQIQQGFDEGVVVPPMQINGFGAFSETAEAGTISFSFDLDCADEYAIWVYVYDGEPGPFDIFPGDAADAYAVDADGTAIDWQYGCDTLLAPWSWQAISTHEPDCAGDDMVVFEFPPGRHTLELRNLEAGDASALPPTAAMLSSVIITNDLDYHP